MTGRTDTGIDTEQAVNRILHWCTFGDYRAYILMAIARRTFNPDLTNSSEIVHRRVLTCEDDVEDMVDNLSALMERHDHQFRLYLTVNARHTRDAYFTFRDTMNGWVRDLCNGDTHAIPKFGAIGSRWKSALHSPDVKDDQYFQFDLDDVGDDEIPEFVESVPTDVVNAVPTPNGYHFITKPFNYTDWEPPVAYDDLDTDGQLFIAEMDAQTDTTVNNGA